MTILLIIIKLVVTFLSSLIFGIERQRSHKPVGFGTFIFVSIGSCALGTIAVSDRFTSPISLLGAIVTGIGFLGAGALIKGPDKVFGFTTAASLWLFAILGLTIGIGEYITASTLYALVWVVILFDKHLEKKSIGTYQRKITIVANKSFNEKKIKDYLLAYTSHSKILHSEVDKEKNEVHLTYLIEGSRENINQMIGELYKESWFKSAKVE